MRPIWPQFCGSINYDSLFNKKARGSFHGISTSLGWLMAGRSPQSKKLFSFIYRFFIIFLAIYLFCIYCFIFFSLYYFYFFCYSFLYFYILFFSRPPFSPKFFLLYYVFISASLWQGLVVFNPLSTRYWLVKGAV